MVQRRRLARFLRFPRLLLGTACGVALSGCHIHMAMELPESAIPESEIVASRAPRTTPIQQTPLVNNAVRYQPSVLQTGVVKPSVVRSSHTDSIVFEEPAALPILSPPPAPGIADPLKNGSAEPLQTPLSLETGNSTTVETRQYDLPTVLSMAGGQNWAVQLAAERTHEAHANWEAARAKWIPSLVAGVGWTKHDGQIQATNGQVVDVSRNSLFVGGGAITKNGPPLTGGAGGPARLAVDLSLTDAIFEPKTAHHLLHAEQAGHSAVFNKTLLQAGLAYYDLVKAQRQLANARELFDIKTQKNISNRSLTQELRQLTKAFQQAGKGSEADIARTDVELSTREQEIVKAELAIQLASAELVRILQLDAEQVTGQFLLTAHDVAIVPIQFVAAENSLAELIAQGLTYRPEISAAASRMQAVQQQVSAEKWRPFLPNLHMGVSAGGFGGGQNGNLSQLDGRSDVDLLAVWQLKNLGFGTAAARRQQASRLRQTMLVYHRIRDGVAADVTKAYAEVQAEQKRMKLAEQNVAKAMESYNRHIARIRGLAGLPLEALQAVKSVVNSRQQYLDSVTAYNKAQLKLLHAIGRNATETE